MLLTALIFIVVLSVLVLVHEYGHFFVARRFGVKAEEFGLGFPPRALGWYKNQAGQWRTVLGNRSADSLQTAPQATVYSLNWLPLGGFVKIKGENGDGENESDSFGQEHREESSDTDGRRPHEYYFGLVCLISGLYHRHAASHRYFKQQRSR